MEEVNDANFEAEVLQSDRPVIVDFWAPWCGPCRLVEPIFEELADAQNGRVRFVKLNVDENFVTASRHQVLSIPTAILFDAGEAKSTVVGARSRAHFEDAWKDWLETSPVEE